MSSPYRLLAGVPSDNMTVYHRIRFDAHDPVSLIIAPNGERTLILRDVELENASKSARADVFHVYEDFMPEGGLSGDRPVRAAQATAECLKRIGVTQVTADRSLSLLFIDELRIAGIGVTLDRDLGIADRRSKDEEEVAALREATRITESAMRMACETIARSEAGSGGVLMHGGEPLTSERVRAMIVAHLAGLGGITDAPIVAGGPHGAVCHDHGTGELRTGEPVIIDIFPKHVASGYHGDCTRVVAHGDIPDEVIKMHAAVKAAKDAGIAATRADATGEDVHRVVVGVIEGAG